MIHTTFETIPHDERKPLWVIALTPAGKDYPLVWDGRTTQREAEEFASAKLHDGYIRADVFQQVPVSIFRRLDE